MLFCSQSELVGKLLFKFFCNIDNFFVCSISCWPRKNKVYKSKAFCDLLRLRFETTRPTISYYITKGAVVLVSMVWGFFKLVRV